MNKENVRPRLTKKYHVKMDGKMLLLKWFVSCGLTNKSNEKMAATEISFEKKSEFVNLEYLEFFIQIILSVTKITEEDDCSLPCQ